MLLLSSAAVAQTGLSDSSGLMMLELYAQFDLPIDAERYMIRPGEKIAVTFVKARLGGLTLVVDPEGRVVHPSLGVLELGDKSLSQARTILLAELGKLYTVEEIVVSVGDPRPVAIVISGAVANPGCYIGFTSQRVSDIIDLAGGIEKGGSRRWITFSGGPEVLTVDLEKAFNLGDVSANPCLYAGTHIHVPGKSRDVIQVVGEVNQPRDVELVPGDDLGTLLAIAGGPRTVADSSNIRIFDLANQTRSSGEGLRPGDVVMVPPYQQSSGCDVVVYGAVLNSGHYGLEDGSTVEQLLALAGGVTDVANTSLVTVFRLTETDQLGRSENTRYPVSHFGTQSQPDGRLVLRAGDSVFVPRAVGWVAVSGEVPRPGLFSFAAGKSASYYIDAAGGFLPRAETGRVFVYDRVARVTHTRPLGVVVNDGNEVIVMLREEFR